MVRAAQPILLASLVPLRISAAALAEHRTGSAHRRRAAAEPDRSFGFICKVVDALLPEQALYSLWFRLVP